MNKWVRHSLNVGALSAGALLVSGAAAQAHPALLSNDNVGIGNGTQLYTPIQAPINICGNAAAVAGIAAAGCEGGSAASLNPEWSFRHFQLTSGDNVGIANGIQAAVPIQAPVNVCGNAAAVAGIAAAGCDGGATADHGRRSHRPHQPDYGDDHGYDYERAATTNATGAAAMLTTGNLGVLNGTQAAAPIQIPIDICGNAIAVLGAAIAGCEGGATAKQ